MGLFSRRTVDKRTRIGGEYKILEKIGEGTYGLVYKVVDRNGQKYAAKFEKRRTFVRATLRNEQNLIQSAPQKRRPGQVYTYFQGTHGVYRVVVMDLLGTSLAHYCVRYGSLSLYTVLMFGVQATSRLEELHDRGIIHRDVKPDNFVCGRHGEDKRTIYLIDLGLARCFRDHRSHRHVGQRAFEPFYGTRVFAPLHSHRRETHSRRSDLESLVYSLVYLYEGRLQWERLSEKGIGKMKEHTSPADLCKNLPDEVAQYFREVLRLRFEERPNYCKLRNLLLTAVVRAGSSNCTFDWMR